jgi:hypothetical protein
MKKWNLVLLLGCTVIVGSYLFFNPAKYPLPTTTEESSSAASSVQQSSIRQNSPADGSGVLPSGISSNSSPSTPANLADQAGIGAPAAATAEYIPPAIVVENVSRAIRQYGTMFAGNPVGTNPEITAELNGGNPKHINFIQPDAGMRINEKGELVDAWGTPLFFHQISGTETEIRSAGPDKIMWTHDDLVAK